MLRIADVPVVVVFLPELSLAIQETIACLGGERFPSVHDFIETKAGDGFNHGVNMVRHHDPRHETIALAIEMKQGILDNLCNTGVAQMAGSISTVQRFLDFPAQLRVVLLSVC